MGENYLLFKYKSFIVSDFLAKIHIGVLFRKTSHINHFMKSIDIVQKGGYYARS